METQFQYIVDQAKQYKSYSDNPGILIDAINNLPQNVIDEIYNEYGNSNNKLQPVTVNLNSNWRNISLRLKEIIEIED